MLSISCKKIACQHCHLPLNTHWAEMLYWLLLRFLLRKLLKQGFDHYNNLVNIHRTIQDTLEMEFPEDNESTRETFDFECRTKAWSRI